MVLYAGLLVFHAPMAQAAQDIYRWVDEKGVVHYSARPPQGYEYKKVNPNTSSVGTVAAQKPARKDLENTISSRNEVEESTASSPEEVAAACERTRQALAGIESTNRVMVTGEDGEPRRLTDDERLQWLYDANEFLQKNCR